MNRLWLMYWHTFLFTQTHSISTLWHTFSALLISCHAVTQQTGSSAAAGAPELRKDTGRFDWKQIQAYEQLALTLGPHNFLYWMLMLDARVVLLKYKSISVCVPFNTIQLADELTHLVKTDGDYIKTYKVISWTFCPLHWKRTNKTFHCQLTNSSELPIGVRRH